jgi:hypothetical protein
MLLATVVGSATVNDTCTTDKFSKPSPGCKRTILASANDSGLAMVLGRVVCFSKERLCIQNTLTMKQIDSVIENKNGK